MNMHLSRKILLGFLVLLLPVILSVSRATAAPFTDPGPGVFDLSWWTVDGGGDTSGTAGSFSLGGTIGQPDAGTSIGHPFIVDAGFWGGVLDNPPTDLDLDNNTIAENQPIGTITGSFSTTDPDPADTFIYSLVTGSGDADNASFGITGDQLVTAAIFDFETKSSYSVRIRTTDNSGLGYEDAFTLTVTDVNEAPLITSNGGGSAASVSIPENTTVVTTVTATDPDAGATLTYSISGGVDAARFTINASSGVLAFASPPDFENPTDVGGNNIYNVTVQVSDGSLTDSQAIAVAVTNVNEAPLITSNGGGPAASLSVPENTTAVTTVTATDPDAGATLTYSISGGVDAARFTINAASGVLAFASPPVFANPTDVGGNNIYNVTVQVSDGSLTDSQAISVTVTAAPTPTATKTPTKTATATSTRTFTATPTHTSSRTSTPTQTRTGVPPTSTYTPTATSTWTSSRTSSPTQTRTGLPPASTHSPTVTTTRSPSRTSTRTPTATATPSVMVYRVYLPLALKEMVGP